MIDWKKLWRTQAPASPAARWARVLSLSCMLALALYTALAIELGETVQRALRQSGFPDAKVQPVLIGWNFARTDDLRLDAAGMNRIRRVQVRFTPASLMAGRVESLELGGIRLEVRPFGVGTAFPGFVPSPSAQSGAVPMLPVNRIVISDITADVVTPTGPVLIASTGGVVRQSASGAQAVWPVRVEHQAMVASGTLQAQTEPNGVTAHLKLDRAILSDQNRRLDAFAADLATTFANGQFMASAEVSGSLSSAAGPIRFAFHASHAPPGDNAQFKVAVARANLSGRIQAVAGDKAGPKLDGVFAVRSLDPAILGGGSGQVNLDLRAQGSVSGRLIKMQVTGSGDAASGQITIKPIQMRGPLNLGISSGEISVAAPDCLFLDLSGISASRTANARLSTSCIKSEPDEPLLSLVNRANGSPLLAFKGQMSGAKGNWTPGRNAQAWSLLIRDAHWDFRRRDGLLSGEARANVADNGKSAFFAPVDLTARVRSDVPGQIGVTFDGAQGQDLIRFRGNLQWGQGGIGGGGLRIGPLRIAAGSHWAERALPGLRQVQGLAGDLEALGEAEWNRDGLRSHGRLQIHRGDIAAYGLKASGVDTDLAASSVWPVIVPVPQEIKIERLDAGIMLENLAFTLRVPGAGQMEIQHGQAGLAGGLLDLQPFVADVSKRTAGTIITASGLQVAEVLKLIGIDGLSGKGVLSGHVPVEVEGDAVKIKDGVLESRDGTLAYAPDDPPKLFEQSQAKLALEALRDFHYDLLTLTLDGVSSGESRAVLSLRGRNPSFYNGKMVQFTLNLSGALDTILRHGISAYTLPSRVRTQFEHSPQQAP